MNVNITGIYDNTVIVDTNLFEDVRLLQTGLSSLSDTLFRPPSKYINDAIRCPASCTAISVLFSHSIINPAVFVVQLLPPP